MSKHFKRSLWGHAWCQKNILYWLLKVFVWIFYWSWNFLFQVTQWPLNSLMKLSKYIRTTLYMNEWSWFSKKLKLCCGAVFLFGIGVKARVRKRKSSKFYGLGIHSLRVCYFLPCYLYPTVTEVIFFSIIIKPEMKKKCFFEMTNWRIS